jgi:hypothetical protein
MSSQQNVDPVGKPRVRGLHMPSVLAHASNKFHTISIVQKGDIIGRQVCAKPIVHSDVH